jgi:hypothetical protein
MATTNEWHRASDPEEGDGLSGSVTALGHQTVVPSPRSVSGNSWYRALNSCRAHSPSRRVRDLRRTDLASDPDRRTARIGAGVRWRPYALSRSATRHSSVPSIGINLKSRVGAHDRLLSGAHRTLDLIQREPTALIKWVEGLAGMILATSSPANKDDYSTMPGPLGARRPR